MPEKIATLMIGRRVVMRAGSANWPKWAGQAGEIVNVYLRDGEPAYGILFPCGTLLEGVYEFGFSLMETATQQAHDALNVLLLTAETRAYLLEHDPQAYKQAVRAVKRLQQEMLVTPKGNFQANEDGTVTQR